MYVDPNAPLPIPDDKEDYLGSVLNAFIGIHNARLDNRGDVEELKQKAAAAQTNITAMLDGFVVDVDTLIAAHVNKKGAIHGETRESIGLGKVDNWRMGTLEEHKAGTLPNVYANPVGLREMILSRLTIDPVKYVRSRLIPVASGGQLGTIPQTPFDWRDGEVVQSFKDPLSFLGDTPWQFTTDGSIYLLPSLNGSETLTQVTADAGRAKRVSTPYGGMNVRIFNGNIDARRSRPAQLRAESNFEPTNSLVKASAHLFDRHSVSYAESTMVGLRSFNRYRLPFDVLTNNGAWKNTWKGILEVRENYIYNLISSLVFSDVEGTGQDLYLKLELGVYTFTDSGLDTQKGPGQRTETTASINETWTDIQYLLGGSSKLKLIKPTTGASFLVLKLRDIVSYTDAQLTDLATLVNRDRAEKMVFAWRNRLGGQFALRIPLGFTSKNNSQYNNFYLDLSFTVKEVTSTKTVTVNVSPTRDLDGNVQKLNNNLELDKQGRFVSSGVDARNDVFHPLVFDGSFNSLGGHIKAYTFYNRQYLGHYRHEITGALNWISKGDTVKPTLSKYRYTQVSTLNQDGFYGDHLRHIPLKAAGGFTDYLVQSRDWTNTYRWVVARVETDATAELLTPTGHHHGPWRTRMDWLDDPSLSVPSFVISNDADLNDFENTCLVFNTQNKFQGYGRYGYDVNNKQVPVQFLDPTKLDDTISNWVAVNGGGWIQNHRQFFYFNGVVFWVSQSMATTEIKADGTDCYYGFIRNAYIEVVGDQRVIKINGPLDGNAAAYPLKVNKASSLDTDTRNVVGWDAFNATDVYLFLMNQTGTKKTYQLMLNLAPFNNFYFEFEASIDSATGAVTIAPKANAVDPVFPYSQSNGFNVDYTNLSQWGKKTPHQFHINYQTPVMLKKSMWSFRKTPGQYGLFTKTKGTVVVSGGLMSSVKGTPIYPVGSVITAGGANIFAKSPVSARSDYFQGNDELFVKLYEATQTSTTSADGALLFGVKHNPNGTETEPNSGIIPCGFLKDEVFTHYDPVGFRSALLPVVDGKRMNFYGYGSSFPVFMGTYGKGSPINRFFLTSRATTMAWDTTVGRSIPMGTGTNVSVKVNGEAQSYTGQTTFDIPAKYTGVVTVEIFNSILIKWAAGLAALRAIGSAVTTLDFTNSTNFAIQAALPARFASLSGLFRDAVGDNYPGLDAWDVSNVTDFSNMFNGAVNFNQNLTAWNTVTAVTFEGMFLNCAKYNQPMGTWKTSRVLTLRNMFNGAAAFNQDISTWDVIRVSDFSQVFMGATAFNGNLSKWDTRSGTTFVSMFENAIAFNIDIGAWDMGAAQFLSRMFAGALAFNANIAGWNTSGVGDMSAMFMNTQTFNRKLGSWNVSRVTNFQDMFNSAQAFGVDGSADLSGWNVSAGVNFTRMFKQAKFNSPLTNWAPGEGAILNEMFRLNTVFNQDLSGWDWSKVVDVSNMLANTAAFDTDLVDIDVRKVKSFNGMFNNAQFTKSVRGWKLPTTAFATMFEMFAGCYAWTGDGVETWNVGHITDFTRMFFGCTIFNGDVSGWNTGYGTTFTQMFSGTRAFNQPLDSWDVSLATSLKGMFSLTDVFNQPLNSWNTRNVTDFSEMFMYAKAFDQPLGNWDTRSGTSFVAMFRGDDVLGVTVFNQDISTWNLAASKILSYMFAANRLFNQDLSAWSVAHNPTHVNFDLGATGWKLARPNFPS